MHVVIGRFRSPFETEAAVLQLLTEQYQRSQLQVVVMRKPEIPPHQAGIMGWFLRGGVLGDTMTRADGRSVLDGAAAGAVLGGLGGVVAGAAVRFGPVALGFAGMIGGGIAGFLLDVAISRSRGKTPAATVRGSTLLNVACATEEQAARAEGILRASQAVEIGRS